MGLEYWPTPPSEKVLGSPGCMGCFVQMLSSLQLPIARYRKTVSRISYPGSANMKTLIASRG